MPQGIEAPASTTAEGPTSHTQNQVVQPANTFGYSREEQIEALHKLREPFAPAEIRHLPRVWCGACKNAPRGQSCQKHPITKCGACKQKMPNGGHIDLAYVGHAEATNRLLNVDPFWGYEPMSLDERGLPQADGYKGLWIRLTVCGMTRLGYGHAGDKTGGDAIKEVIGDAIRNAGMRFGMALDLWTTSDLEIIESGGASLEQDGQGAESKQTPPPGRSVQGGAQSADLDAFQERVRNGWNHVEATQMALAEAKKKGINPVVPFEGDHLHIQDVLEIRIKQLKERAAQGGNTEGNAA